MEDDYLGIMHYRFLPSLFASHSLLLACLLASCATPQLPPGGPVDTDGPVLISTEPDPGAVEVTASQLTLRFDEYVDHRSLEQAFSITPEFSEPVRFQWFSRGVEVHFPEPLRANTTYVVTIGTEFQDVRSQKIKQPITLAFATGSTLNEGTLGGLLLDPTTGKPVPDLDVFAYTLADSLPPDPRTTPPSYRTQTGATGRFTFAYLGNTPFYLLALRDRNRNRRLDAGEFFAVPSASALVPTDSITAIPLFWLARLDTTAPVLQRIRAVNTRRTEIRFDEPVLLASRKPELWMITDSLTGQPVGVEQVYQPPNQSVLVMLETEPLQNRPYRVRVEPGAVADTSGTPSAAFLATFSGSTRPDTLSLRIATFLPVSPDSVITLRPGQLPGLRFSLPPDTALIRTTATLTTPSGTLLPYRLRRSSDGTSIFFEIPPPAPTFRITLDGIPYGTDSLLAQPYQRFTADETGGLTGVVQPAENAVVELFAARETQPRHVALADATGTFIFSDLPAGYYRLRAYLDTDGNKAWSPGTAFPYRAAESLAWAADSVRVRARFINTLPDTLRIASGALRED